MSCLVRQFFGKEGESKSLDNVTLMSMKQQKGQSVAVIILVAALLLFLVISQIHSSALMVSGIVEADEARVGSRVGGRVAKVLVEEGKRVQVGDVLLEIEPFDLLARKNETQAQLEAAQAELDLLSAGFRSEEIAAAKAKQEQARAVLDRLTKGPRTEELEAARARLEQAQAELKLAEQNFVRQQSLLERKIVSRQVFDETARSREAARGRVQEMEAKVRELEVGSRTEEIAEARSAYEAAEQDLLLMTRGYRTEEIKKQEALVAAAKARFSAIEMQLSELVVRAPIAGVVNSLQLVSGDIVAPNAPLLTIIDISHFWLRAYLPESALNIQPGAKADIEFDSIPGKIFQGTVSFLSTQAEFTPSNVQTSDERSKQVFRIKVNITGGEGELWPGMMADIRLQ